MNGSLGSSNDPLEAKQRCYAWPVSDYRKLHVWQKAHAMSLAAVRIATRIRGAQFAAFKSQITRAAMSVPTNIVEGRDQQSEAGFARYLRIAIGSASELEYHLLAARDMDAISRSEHHALSAQVVEVRMMLNGLVRRLERSSGTTAANRDQRPGP